MFFSKNVVKVYKILLMFYVIVFVIAVIHVDAWWVIITVTLSIMNYGKVIIYGGDSSVPT